MKISVLFPVYNTNEEYLRQAIESILSQTFSDFEFLIVNDNSTDLNVENVIKSYDDPRIKYFVNDNNLGISGTRNRLLSLAQGEYLAVMDHDDISLPERFKKQIEYLDSHPEVGVISCYVGHIHRNARIDKNPENHDDICMALFGRCGSLTHPAAMIRKSVLTDNNLRYEEEFSPAEDYALWCRLMTHTKFHNIPEVLFIYRKHKTNTTKLQAERLENAVAGVRAFMQVDNPELYRKFLLRSTQIIKIRLFNFIPLLKIVTRRSRTKVYIFEKIPILSIKSSRMF